MAETSNASGNAEPPGRIRGPSRRAIILFAAILSVFIYLAGVLSGLYANKILQTRVEQDIGKVEQGIGEVEQNVDFLKRYVDSSALDMKNVLLLQFFMDQIDSECKFSGLYLQNLHKQLEPYWEKLPKRLEEYEKESEQSSEYITLKREYTRLSLRIWLLARNNYRKCNNTNFVPLLYFYTKKCNECVNQGEVLDSFQTEMAAGNISIVIFPVDESFEDDTVYLLKQYYNLTKFPSIILNDNIFQGRVVEKDELASFVQKQ